MNSDNDATHETPPVNPWSRPWSTDVEPPVEPPTAPVAPVAPAPVFPAYSPPRPEPQRQRGPGWLAVAAVAALIGAIIGAGAYGVADRLDDEGPASTTERSTVATSGRESLEFQGDPLSVKDVVAKVQPAVVAIGVSGLEGRGAGTGMILTPDGEVLTNRHVVQGATRIRVTLAGENQPRDADLIGTCCDDGSQDIALIKIRDAQNLPVVELGVSDQAQVGDDVVAIGNALALIGGPTVTTGIISAKDRSLEGLDGLIQTDTAINQGNSGGPLVNAAGQVIGVNTAVIRGGAEGIGFSIAIDNAKPVIEGIRSGEPQTAGGFLGISSQTLTPDIAANLDVPVESGAVIVEVVPDSGAEAAGLERGDVIVEIDGREVTAASTVGAIVREKEAGDEVEIVYYRGGERMTATATLSSRPG
jgi:S1-C subfamily serine protease